MGSLLCLGELDNYFALTGLWKLSRCQHRPTACADQRCPFRAGVDMGTFVSVSEYQWLGHASRRFLWFWQGYGIFFLIFSIAGYARKNPSYQLITHSVNHIEVVLSFSEFAFGICFQFWIIKYG